MLQSLPSLMLDHLVVIAPTVQEGVAHVRDQIGLEMQAGGDHAEMGTHNRLLRLRDDVFLEVIAADPNADRPARLRWFGLDDPEAVRSAWDKGHGLRAWVARTSDLDAILARHGAMLGQKIRVSRGDRSWFISVLQDGSLPVGGVAPLVIDWGDRGSPASGMPDVGAGLISFSIEHPDPTWVLNIYARLRVSDPPAVRQGAQLRYRALIQTPSGAKELC